MSEWKLFEGDTPFVSTAEFHMHRERAPHLEQPIHRDRLELAASFVEEAVLLGKGKSPNHNKVVDLGCGDGGLLSLLRGRAEKIVAWGYDFQPSNRAGWIQRRVSAVEADVFGKGSDLVCFGNVAVTTEVLEHLADPHGAVRWIGNNTSFLIASSPFTETGESHDECHAWAWDMAGYRALIEQGGFAIRRHEAVGMFQVVLAERKIG